MKFVFGFGLNFWQGAGSMGTRLQSSLHGICRNPSTQAATSASLAAARAGPWSLTQLSITWGRAAAHGALVNAVPPLLALHSTSFAHAASVI